MMAAALVAMPVSGLAQDQTNAPAAPTAKKLPIHGKAAAVDTAKMTLTVGESVLNVTSTTKISKDGKPATLSDIKVGDTVSASYKKGDDGSMNATMIRDGKAGAMKHKKAATDASTNAPAAQ